MPKILDVFLSKYLLGREVHLRTKSEGWVGPQVPSKPTNYRDVGCAILKLGHREINDFPWFPGK